MSKNHEQVILELEHRLFAALIASNAGELKAILHENAVYTSEYGETFHGTSSCPPDDGLFKISAIKVIKRDITFFNNIAIVNTIEQRSCTDQGIKSGGEICCNRIWKFNGKTWHVIFGSKHLL